MTGSDDEVGGTWPDRGEWKRWRDALAETARRLQEERGVEEPWRLTVDRGALWAEYGDLRLRVAGGDVVLIDPDDLWAEVDHWAAFERTAGPGRVLDRDRHAMAEWRQRLPAMQQFWLEVARLVFRDVEATTNLRPRWNVVVHEDEAGWPAIRNGIGAGGAVGGIVHEDLLVSPPGRRPLDFPQVWIETDCTGRSLPDMDDEALAIGYLAEMVQEDVIEEIHGAWPPCPRHAHPLDVHYSDTARPTWTCPGAPDLEVAIGELARLADPSV